MTELGSSTADEQFQLETELVLLNYLSLVPTPTGSSAGSSFGGISRSTSTRSGNKRHLTKDHLKNLNLLSKNAVIERYRESLTSYQELSDTVFQRSLSDGDRSNSTVANWLERGDGRIDEHPVRVIVERASDSSDDTSLRPAGRKVTGSGKSKNGHSSPQPDTLLEAQIYDGDTKRPSSLSVIRGTLPPHGGSPQRGSGPDRSRTISPISADSKNGHHVYMAEIDEDDDYVRSEECSTESSPARSMIDLRRVKTEEVVELIHQHALPESSIVLKEVIEENFTEIERRKSVRTSLKLSMHGSPLIPPLHGSGEVPLSPESLVAAHLGLIGDRIQEQYGNRLDIALQMLMARPNGYTYDDFQIVANNLVENTEGVTKLSLAMLFVRQIAIKVVSSNTENIRNLISWATRFITEHTSDYILRNGGWSGLVELDELTGPNLLVSPTSDDPDSKPVETPRFYDVRSPDTADTTISSITVNSDRIDPPSVEDVDEVLGEIDILREDSESFSRQYSVSDGVEAIHQRLVTVGVVLCIVSVLLYWVMKRR